MSRAATTRRPLSKQRVLRAAMKLADSEGLDALSMRRLARQLGVKAMSLYNHVANKDEILDGLVDEVTREIDLPEDVDWNTAIRRHAISARDVFIRHKWASNLLLERQNAGTARMRMTDWQLRKLREGGFSDAVVYHAFHVVEAYILGFTRLQLSVPYTRDELAGKAAEFIESLPLDDYPDLVEHIRQHMAPSEPDHGHGQSGFELGLDLILDGLERLRDTR
jgi:AcrR family transcriptional regulator